MSERKPLDVEALTATFSKVRLPLGLLIDEIAVDGGPARCTFDPFRIHLERPGDLRATISESSVAAFLDEQAPGGLRDFTVRFHGGKVTVQATAKVIIDIRATTVCTLRIVEGKCIYVDLETIDAIGGGAARGMVESQLAKINPIVDARQFPLDVVLTKLEMGDGRLTIFGTASPQYGPTIGA